MVKSKAWTIKKKIPVFTYAFIGELGNMEAKGRKSGVKIRDAFPGEELLDYEDYLDYQDYQDYLIMKNKWFLVWDGRSWWEEHVQPQFPMWALQIIFLSPKQIIIIPFEEWDPLLPLRPPISSSFTLSIYGRSTHLKTQPKTQLCVLFWSLQIPKTLSLPDSLTTICFRLMAFDYTLF